MQLVAAAGLIAASSRTAPVADVVRPADCAGVLAALAGCPAPVLVAGGTHLCAEYLTGLRPGTLIALDRVRALAEITRAGDELRIGALVTHHDGPRHPLVQALLPGFAAAWSMIANVRVRRWASIGGNLMARCSRYEMAVLLSALDARLCFLRADGGFERIMPAHLAAGPARPGLLHHIAIPLRPGHAFSYRRELRPAVTVAVCRDAAGVRAAIATEYLAPVRLEDGRIDGLPEAFADAVSSAWYLRRAGAVLLARGRADVGLDG